MHPELLRAKELAETEPDEALRICSAIMNTEFDSEIGQMALFITGYIMLQAERFGLAYQIYKRCAELRPNLSEIYSNMGMCLEQEKPEQALECFKQALRLNSKNVSALNNLALMKLHTNKPGECVKICRQVLKDDPDNRAARHNMGLAKLMQRDHSGWVEYRETLGVKGRPGKDYGFPEWNGEPGTVLVYGEQGVGDELMFASCLPDLQKNNKVIFDCDKRLASIFKRNFDFEIHGERFSNAPLELSETPKYQCAIGQLPYFFRRNAKDYPGTPYLTPCPERAQQWECLLSDGFRIGIAWRGGLKNTKERDRSMDLETLDPLLCRNSFEFVNLEYKPVDQSAMDYYGIKNWPRAVLKGADLEETLALISRLDCVVTACTTVVYMAGALGVPCFVMVPENPGYRYYDRGEGFPWHSSVKLFRGKFSKTIGRIVEHVENLHRVRTERSSGIPCAVPLHSAASKRPGDIHTDSKKQPARVRKAH